jgi:hypothetical protein
VHCGMGDGMEDQWSSVCCHSSLVVKFSSDRRRLIFDEISRGILAGILIGLDSDLLCLKLCLCLCYSRE